MPIHHFIIYLIHNHDIQKNFFFMLLLLLMLCLILLPSYISYSLHPHLFLMYSHLILQIMVYDKIILKFIFFIFHLHSILQTIHFLHQIHLLFILNISNSLFLIILLIPYHSFFNLNLGILLSLLMFLLVDMIFMVRIIFFHYLLYELFL